MRLGKERGLPLDFPVEYKNGFVKFLNCKIDLRNRVFIPRIETEFWVSQVLKELKNAEKCSRHIKMKKLRILDIFAGSGCIGIAILKARPKLCRRVDFIDIDEKAISQIKINLRLNEIPKNRYRIYKSNLFEKFTPHRTCSGAGLKNKKYDYIFANPPYVAKGRLNEVQPSVLKYEPKRAILAGKGGLFYIRKFLKESKNFLKPNGVIYLEIDPQQKDDIENILEKQRYKKSKFFKDQFKKYRFVKINVT